MGAKESPITKYEGWFIGENRSLQWDVTQSDDETPQAMTGWALLFQLKVSKNVTATIMSKTTGAGEISIGNGVGTNDRATLTINNADYPAGMKPGHYHYQLKRTGDGLETVLAYGDAVIMAEAFS